MPWRIVRVSGLLGALAFFTGLAIAPEARGHGVGYLILDTAAIVVQFVYSSGEPLAYAKITVWAPKDTDTEFQNGRADRHGRFAFIPTQAGRWKVAANDGRGHKLTALCDVDASLSIATSESTHGPSKATGTLLGISLIANLTLGAAALKKKNAPP